MAFGLVFHVLSIIQDCNGWIFFSLFVMIICSSFISSPTTTMIAFATIYLAYLFFASQLNSMKLLKLGVLTLKTLHL